MTTTRQHCTHSSKHINCVSHHFLTQHIKSTSYHKTTAYHITHRHNASRQLLITSLIDTAHQGNFLSHHSSTQLFITLLIDTAHQCNFLADQQDNLLSHHSSRQLFVVSLIDTAQQDNCLSHHSSTQHKTTSLPRHSSTHQDNFLLHRLSTYQHIILFFSLLRCAFLSFTFRRTKSLLNCETAMFFRYLSTPQTYEKAKESKCSPSGLKLRLDFQKTRHFSLSDEKLYKYKFLPTRVQKV